METVELKIKGFANGGYGISEYNGKIVFVDYVLPREVILAKITKDKKNHAFAELKSVLKPSAHRVQPKCKYYYECGGCNLQHAGYKYQLKLKQEVFVNTLKRVGKIEPEKTPEIIESKKQWDYRKRVNFKCFRGNWGFFKKGSNEFVKIDECPVADKRINEFIKVNRCNSNQEFIHVDDYGNINEDEMLLDLKLDHPLFFRANSFTQVNREVNLKIIEDLKSIVRSLNPVNIAELFCGIGNFTIPLALDGYKILALEYSVAAISSLKRNINAFGLKNISVIKRNLMQPFKIKGSFDLVILDPPRDGAKHAVQWLLNKNIKHVIYISCDPATLARDLNIIKDRYTISSIKLYDMFPQTHHIESMVVLKLNKNSESS